MGTVLLVGCTSQDPQEVSARLEKMVTASVRSVGLDPGDGDMSRTFHSCGDGTEAESLGFQFTNIGREETRTLLPDLVSYWNEVGGEWAREGFEVSDESLDAPTSPRVFLEIDGFSFAGKHRPKEVEGLEIGGSAPCVPDS